MIAPFSAPEPAAEALRELVAVRRSLDALESQLVADLRDRAYTWAQLGEILELTPQGAGRRHRVRSTRRRARSEPFVPGRTL